MQKSISFLMMVILLPLTSHAALTPSEVSRYLGTKTTIVCNAVVPNKNIGVQIQFDGDVDKWVVWYLGDARGAQRILSANATPLEGRNMTTEFFLSLERGTQIALTLDTAGRGNGDILINGKWYSLANCAPEF